MAEVLIAIALIAALALILFPLLKNVMPDKLEALHKKATYIVEHVVAEIAYDEDLYPKTKVTSGLASIFEVKEKGISYGYGKIEQYNTTDIKNNPKAKSKFCELFASRMNLASNSGPITCQEGAKTLTSVEGMDWYLPISNFDGTNPYEIIKVDVNGDKEPNCLYDKESCKHPDTFLYYVRPDGKVFDTPPDDFQNMYNIIVNVEGSATYNCDGGSCLGKAPGSYKIKVTPSAGWTCDWIEKSVTLVDADYRDKVVCTEQGSGWENPLKQNFLWIEKDKTCGYKNNDNGTITTIYGDKRTNTYIFDGKVVSFPKIFEFGSNGGEYVSRTLITIPSGKPINIGVIGAPMLSATFSDAKFCKDAKCSKVLETPFTVRAGGINNFYMQYYGNSDKIFNKLIIKEGCESVNFIWDADDPHRPQSIVVYDQSPSDCDLSFYDKNNRLITPKMHHTDVIYGNSATKGQTFGFTAISNTPTCKPMWISKSNEVKINNKLTNPTANITIGDNSVSLYATATPIENEVKYYTIKAKVTCSDGRSCYNSVSGEGKYQEGYDATIGVNLKDGYEIEGSSWLNYKTIKVTKNETVNINVVPKLYKIKFQTVDNGKIYIGTQELTNNEYTGRLSPGAYVFTSVPNAGYKSDWVNNTYVLQVPFKSQGAAWEATQYMTIPIRFSRDEDKTYCIRAYQQCCSESGCTTIHPNEISGCATFNLSGNGVGSSTYDPNTGAFEWCGLYNGKYTLTIRPNTSTSDEEWIAEKGYDYINIENASYNKTYKIYKEFKLKFYLLEKKLGYLIDEAGNQVSEIITTINASQSNFGKFPPVKLNPNYIFRYWTSDYANTEQLDSSEVLEACYYKKGPYYSDDKGKGCYPIIEYLRSVAVVKVGDSTPTVGKYKIATLDINTDIKSDYNGPNANQIRVFLTDKHGNNVSEIQIGEYVKYDDWTFNPDTVQKYNELTFTAKSGNDTKRLYLYYTDKFSAQKDVDVFLFACYTYDGNNPVNYTVPELLSNRELSVKGYPCHRAVLKSTSLDFNEDTIIDNPGYY